SGARASTGGTNGGATSAGRGGTDQPEGGSASGGESEGGSSALGGSEGAGRGNGGSIVVGGTGGMGGGAGRRGCMGDELPLVPSGTSPCGFALPDAAFDFVRINVWLGNTMLCSAYASDCVPNGWQFSASIDEIILCDDACRAFEATPDAMVTAELGCATVVCD
ncbi:MAG TPA: hypothetical protein VF103_16910, partial [Polyangiaceae bacterium]